MEYQPIVNAYANAKNQMLKILEATKCNDYRLFLTETNDKECFRTKLYKDYKANRKGKERPKYYKEVREYLIKQWKAEVVGTIEADDAVCMIQHHCYEYGFFTEGTIFTEQEFSWTDSNLPSVLCGIDKDLDQVPGLHYNYNKDTFYYITPLQGCKNFYMQILSGDDADNIKRIRKGWGTKKEHKIVKEKLKNALTEQELYTIVYEEIKRLTELDGYIDSIDPNDEIRFKGNLLYLKRFENDYYEVPHERQQTII